MPAGVTRSQGLQPLDPDRFFRVQRHQRHPFRVLFAHRLDLWPLLRGA